MLLLLIFLRIFGGAALFLGLAFWLGYGRSMTLLHMRLGIAVVLCLWAMSALTWWNTARIAPSVFAVVYGLAVVFFGVTHAGILPGPLHWIVQLAHLVLGVGAVAIGGYLAAGVTANRQIRSVRLQPDQVDRT